MGNYSAGLREILVQRIWAIDPIEGAALKAVVQKNISSHEAFTSKNQAEANNRNALFVLHAEQVKQLKALHPEEFTADRTRADLIAPLFTADVYQGDAEYILRWRNIRPDDQVINVIYLTGPMLRHGLCEDGSIYLRDKLIFCSKQPQCIGHLIIIDSPGGVCDTIMDIEQGVAAVREAKQPVIGLIDGMAASAAFWSASMMDELYFMHPENEIGSVGVYCSYFDLEPGAQDTQTQDIYREFYATPSTEKNKMFRDVRDGNTELLQKDLDDCAEKFMSFIKTAKPKTPEEWLHGKVLECKDTVGIWTNGQATKDDCLQRIINLHNN